jgi:hypothetical protein
MDSKRDIVVSTVSKKGWAKETLCVRCASKSQTAEWDGVSIRQAGAAEVGLDQMCASSLKPIPSPASISMTYDPRDTKFISAEEHLFINANPYICFI